MTIWRELSRGSPGLHLLGQPSIPEGWPTIPVALRALCLIIVVVFPRAVSCADVNVPEGSQLVAMVRREHPRLLATIKQFEVLIETTKSVPLLERWRGQLAAEGDRICSEEVASYRIPDGLRLLDTSRRVLERVSTLALLYRLEGRDKWAGRAWKELESAAGFPDWNPRHFLDTAEMARAFAIGYDWLYDRWTPNQRAILRRAIVQKGLQPGLNAYHGTSDFGWWVKDTHNWNQVCNGGLGMAALAIADEEPEVAGAILEGSLRSIPLAMDQFNPDGGCREGPGYWNYATAYNVAFIAALDTSLGTDFHLSDLAGFSETGFFPIYMAGAFGRSFNFSDCDDSPEPAPQLLWLAKRFDHPEYAQFQVNASSVTAEDLLWYDGAMVQAPAPHLPLDKYFRRVEVASMRSSWTDQSGLFLGIKAGDNKANHSHLDLGSFIFDALGTRWVSDLGADNYNLEGYFGRGRWNFYRLRAEGHNTLVLNPSLEPDQDPTASAKIVRFESKPSRALAILDLSAAYSSHAHQVLRGIAMLDRSQVLIQDEVSCDRPADLWWFIHTPAAISLGVEGKSASLSLQNRLLLAQITSPPGAKFTVMKDIPFDCSPHPKDQALNRTTTKLAIHLDAVEHLRLAVTLTPVMEGALPAKTPEVKPLIEW